MEIHGGCHCGNIRYVLEWPGSATVLPARSCTCSYCARHGARWTAHPQARLRVDVADPRKTASYRFGTKTADFRACSVCAVVPLATSRIDGQVFAVVNTNTFAPGSAPDVEVAPASFDGEATADRLARRRQRWIGDVGGV